jgi:hypothetical protein
MICRRVGDSSTRALSAAQINENFDYFYDYMMKVTEFANQSVASRASTSSHLRVDKTRYETTIFLNGH